MVTNHKRKTKRRLGSSASKSAQNEQSALQSEYVNNLQQQIYFLELELQIMKEKATTGQFGGRSSISKTAPIDTHVNSLRDKYTYMEKKFKKKMKSLEESVSKLTNERDTMMSQQRRVNETVDTMTEELSHYRNVEETLREKFLEEKLEIEHKLEKMEQKKVEKEQMYEKERTTFGEFRLAHKKQIHELQDKILDLQHDADRAEKTMITHQEAKKKAEREKLESEEQIHLKEAKLGDMQKEESRLKDELHASENRFRKSQMDLELCKTHSEKFESQCKQFQHQVEELQSQLHVIKQLERDNDVSESRWSHKIVNLETENASLKSKLKYAQEDVEANKAERSNLREELTRVQEQLRDTKETVETLEERLPQLQKRIDELELSHRDLNKDNILKTQSLEASQKAEQELQEKYQTVQQSFDELQSKYSNQEAQLATQNALENINVEEVTRLSAASQDINSSIQLLLATLAKQDSTG